MARANPYKLLTWQQLVITNPHQLSAQDLDLYLEAVEAIFGTPAFTLMVRGDLPQEAEEFITQTDAGERFYAFLSNLAENIAEGPEFIAEDGSDGSDGENQPPPPPPGALAGA